MAHKAIQTVRELVTTMQKKRKPKRKKVQFAQNLEQHMYREDTTTLIPGIHSIQTIGMERPLTVEFARGDRIASVEPKAFKKYLRTIHALTGVEDLAKYREDFVVQMKSKYPDVFSGELQDRGISPVKLYIPTYDEQLYKAPHIYPVPNAYRERVKQTIDDMIDQGVLRHSKSPFAAPLTCVKKKDGSIRVCTDFRALNAIVKQDKYVIPHIDYIKKHILGNIFTTLDLKNGFQQVLINEPDRYKTAMATPWGLLEYCRMPFGLKNAPNCFQRFINIVLYGLRNLFVYIDDVIIFSEDVETL